MVSNTRPTVFIVDDDEAIHEWIREVLAPLGIPTECFLSSLEFLEQIRPDRPGCLVLDVRMPEMDGLELQERLAKLGFVTPIIFLTSYGDIPMAVQAMIRGAFQFLEKPVRDQKLIECIQNALKEDAQRREWDAGKRQTVERLRGLTSRERDVLRLVLEGLPNKAIAHQLSISIKTVEFYRARLMTKLGARSTVELVKIALSVRSSD